MNHFLQHHYYTRRNKRGIGNPVLGLKKKKKKKILACRMVCDGDSKSKALESKVVGHLHILMISCIMHQINILASLEFSISLIFDRTLVSQLG